jgi:hypothetical protein
MEHRLLDPSATRGLGQPQRLGQQSRRIIKLAPIQLDPGQATQHASCGYVISRAAEDGQRPLTASCSILESPAHPVRRRELGHHQGHALIVARVLEQPSGGGELLAGRAELPLVQMQRPDRVEHDRLAADIACLPGGRKGGLAGLLPVVEVGADLEQRGRAERQAPAQPGQPGLGGLPDPGDQRGPFPLINDSIEGGNPAAVKDEASFLTMNQPVMFQPTPDGIWAWKTSILATDPIYLENLTQAYATPEFWFLTK